MRSNSTVKEPTSTTKPGQTSKTNRMLRAQETERQLRASVSLLLEDYNDEKALALVALLELVAYANEFVDRDFMAHIVRSEAFTYTTSFSKACQNFTNRAKQLTLATAA